MESGVPVSEYLAHPVYLNAGEIPVGGRGKLGRTPFFAAWTSMPITSSRYRALAAGIGRRFLQCDQQSEVAATGYVPREHGRSDKPGLPQAWHRGKLTSRGDLPAFQHEDGATARVLARPAR